MKFLKPSSYALPFRFPIKDDIEQTLADYIARRGNIYTRGLVTSFGVAAETECPSAPQTCLP